MELDTRRRGEIWSCGSSRERWGEGCPLEHHDEIAVTPCTSLECLEEDVELCRSEMCEIRGQVRTSNIDEAEIQVQGFISQPPADIKRAIVATPKQRWEPTKSSERYPPAACSEP
jgi:hypothetical protein